MTKRSIEIEFGDESKHYELEEVGNPGCSGGGSAPDWNQNDPNAPGYIKNRPFYSETKTLLETQTIEGFTLNDQGAYSTTITLEYKLNINVGEAIVFFDGVKYICAVEYDEGFDEFSIFPIDSYGQLVTVPFFACAHGTQPLLLVAVNDGNADESHTVGIVQEQPVKIDEKYLPVDKTPTFGVYETDDGTYMLGELINKDAYNVVPMTMERFLELWKNGAYFECIRVYDGSFYYYCTVGTNLDYVGTHMHINFRSENGGNDIKPLLWIAVTTVNILDMRVTRRHFELEVPEV